MKYAMGNLFSSSHTHGREAATPNSEGAIHPSDVRVPRDRQEPNSLKGLGDRESGEEVFDPHSTSPDAALFVGSPLPTIPKNAQGINLSPITGNPITHEVMQLALRCITSAIVLMFLCSCGYHFGTSSTESPFPSDLKTVVLESAVNSTTITGIETELTNDLRQEFAVGRGLKPVRTGGDTSLKTVISSYVDTPASYKADGKELTRIGTLSISCSLVRAGTNKIMWNKDVADSHMYTVTDTISETLTNRRRAISRMIKRLTPQIYQSLHNDF